MDRIEFVKTLRKQLKNEMDKRFHVKHYNLMDISDYAEIELYVQGGKIDLSILDWDGADVCCIEHGIISDLKEDESILTELYKLCIILKELYIIMGQIPEVDFFENKDTQWLDIKILYIVDASNIESIIYVLEAFNRINLNQQIIDKEFIKTNYIELFRLFERISNISRQKLKNLIMTNSCGEARFLNLKYKPVISDLFSESDFVFSNYNQKICIGFTQEGIERYLQKYRIDLNQVLDYYDGLEYNIMKESEVIYVWEKALWREAFKWLNYLELLYNDVPVHIAYGSDRIIIRIIEFWICIMAEADAIEDKILYEKKKIEDMEKKYLKHTNVQLHTIDYNLYQLSPEEFENLCYDILYAEGYNKIQRRGKLNSRDNGVDIEAIEVIRGINAQEEKKWIFQCKRTKRLNKQELQDVPLLLKEFQADRYGLFYAGIFNPSVIDRCKYFDKNSVWLFDENWIKQKLKENINITDKYFPLIKLSL